MAKKSTTPKATEPGVVTASSLPTALAEKPAAAALQKPVRAKKPAKAPAARVQVKAAPVTKSAAPKVTPADIALRAYFIAEKRQKLGLPGDSTSDWVEAERQLKAEAAKAKP
ncbi:MAG: DUF2934 domain-containing protein [Chthoniobacteraceae bacterium]|nr:DUF2934 domain-containing protein [Chthoniobacteraceae bacterium]